MLGKTHAPNKFITRLISLYQNDFEYQVLPNDNSVKFCIFVHFESLWIGQARSVLPNPIASMVTFLCRVDHMFSLFYHVR